MLLVPKLVDRILSLVLINTATVTNAFSTTWRGLYDRCPSSYHARCIGVSKMHIPEGAWYFPECRIYELEPKLKSGTTLKGAKLLGVDSYGQIFLGACGHLLVLKALSGSNSIFRYYNEKDIPILLRALNSNVQHGTLYLEICKGIMQYWKIPVNVLLHNGEPAEIGSQRPDGTRYTISSTQSLNSLVKGSLEKENTGSCATEVSLENASLSDFSKRWSLLSRNMTKLVQILVFSPSHVR